jgi:uncharacterized membrane protein (DUF485 family)
MNHGPATKWGEDKATVYKARLGAYLFFFYVLIYAGFIVINVMDPLMMEKTMFAGLNLAVVYGFGLILLALVMGLIYNHLCTKKENEMEATK